MFIVKTVPKRNDNIHESEALKRYDRQALSLVECQNRKYKIYKVFTKLYVTLLQNF